MIYTSETNHKQADQFFFIKTSKTKTSINTLKANPHKPLTHSQTPTTTPSISHNNHNPPNLNNPPFTHSPFPYRTFPSKNQSNPCHLPRCSLYNFDNKSKRAIGTLSNVCTGCMGFRLLRRRMKNFSWKCWKNLIWPMI